MTDHPRGPWAPGTGATAVHPQHHAVDPAGSPGTGPGPSGPPPWQAPPPAPPGPPPRRRSVAGILTAALLAGAVGGAAGFGGAYALLDEPAAPALGSSAASGPAASSVAGSVAAAAATATPSTVDIRVRTPQGAAEGSGVVLTADGAVLTNAHVVAGATQITVTLADGAEHPASVVGASPSYDLAVLRVPDVTGLVPATLGRSGDVEVGQQVVAIGSPQGLSGTVTTGIVSALDRTVAVQGDDGAAVVYNGLQTDAAINQGNSGGPLVNLDGQVVGVNSAIATTGPSTGSIGLGFAIPVDTARRVAQEILDDGTADKPVLGVEGNPAAPGDGGAVIAGVTPGSGAAAAGLVPGDVVTRVGASGVEDFADLVARIGAQTPGGPVELTVRGSDGAERTVTVTLGATEDRSASTARQEQSSIPFGN